MHLSPTRIPPAGPTCPPGAFDDLLIWNTVPCTDLPAAPVGARTLPDWDKVDPDSYGDALAIHRISGWRVFHDQGPEGGPNIWLEGRDWRGNTRHLPMPREHVRVEVVA